MQPWPPSCVLHIKGSLKPVWTVLGVETIEAVKRVRRPHRGEMPAARPATGPRLWVRCVVPFAAVVAVGLTVALTASISDDQPARLRTKDSVTAGGPRYLLTTELPEQVGAGQRAAIREVATGRVAATIRFPPGVTEFTDLAATGDDRTFLLTGAVGDHWQIFRLHLDGEDRAVTPEPVRHGDVHEPAGLAVTPDGVGLAFGVNHREVSGKYGETPGEIDFLNLSTGRRKAWKTRVWGQLRDLSSSADGTRLAFSWARAGRANDIRVLDTGRPGELLHRARPIVGSTGAFQQAHHPLISPDGRTLSMVVVQRDQRGQWIRLIEVAAATGRQLRVLYEERYLGAPDLSGHVFNAICRSGPYVLIVDGRRTLRVDTTTGRAVHLPYPDADPDQVAC
jgi:hypothetical protein